ncbi:MAG: hypothetical protein JHD05_08725, partial [Thermoleophilia bacterium]|nr:hypothetical protein [Thermoleophilia bacterium]
QCLWGDPTYLTITGTRALLERLAPFDPAYALEGHDENVADATAYASRLSELRAACRLVEELGNDAVAAAGEDTDLVETIGHLLAGR